MRFRIIVIIIFMLSLFANLEKSNAQPVFKGRISQELYEKVTDDAHNEIPMLLKPIMNRLSPKGYDLIHEIQVSEKLRAFVKNNKHDLDRIIELDLVKRAHLLKEIESLLIDSIYEIYELEQVLEIRNDLDFLKDNSEETKEFLLGAEYNIALDKMSAIGARSVNTAIMVAGAIVLAGAVAMLAPIILSSISFASLVFIMIVPVSIAVFGVSFHQNIQSQKLWVKAIKSMDSLPLESLEDKFLQIIESYKQAADYKEQLVDDVSGINLMP